ncbi:unnamed protein product [Phytomonas sp. Hart1]|nr:unnamed protein product [Phytomonas sp. Hart1]|eukprot:CCW68696.1 unnamed protein product [Phytomonas sp. isolate Hart1]
MTEVGMALGQPLRPDSARIPGTVGSPFPTVRTRLLEAEAADKIEESSAHGRAEVGVLAVASPSVFDRYWNNPEATLKELYVDADGVRYFRTGDTVQVQYPPPDAKDTPPLFTIMGRTSVDIIKSNGNKLSALEIEARMLLHGDIFYEVAVVGVAHAVKGEEVVAVVALHEAAARARAIVYDSRTNAFESDEINTELRTIVSDVLAPYKCPRRYICVHHIPRNDTGKVNKVALKLLLNLR